MCGCVALSLSVPFQVESPSPVARYQSVPVTESGVYKGSPVFAAERPTSPLLQTEHFSGLLLALWFVLCISKWLIVILSWAVSGDYL